MQIKHVSICLICTNIKLYRKSSIDFLFVFLPWFSSLIWFFGKLAHFSYQKVANLHIFDIKEEIEAYKRNSQKQKRKSGKQLLTHVVLPPLIFLQDHLLFPQEEIGEAHHQNAFCRDEFFQVCFTFKIHHFTENFCVKTRIFAAKVHFLHDFTKFYRELHGIFKGI